MTRQRKLQLEKSNRHECPYCPNPKPPDYHCCDPCREKKSSAQRARQGHGEWKPGKKGRIPKRILAAVLSKVDWRMTDENIAVFTGLTVTSVRRNRPKS